MDLHFACTICANCCQHSKIPLTVAEAISWTERGHQVQVVCQAFPWTPAQGARADYLVHRSFPARSGAMPIRVAVTLAANLSGKCPNLLADKRCGIYERRPLVCKTYPAETNPFTPLDPTTKACPSEAWSNHHPLILRDGRVATQALQADIFRWRELDERDVNVKRKVCASLNLVVAAIDGEGFFVHSPAIVDLHEVLSLLKDETDAAPSQMRWTLVTDRADTLEQLVVAGAAVRHPRDFGAGSYSSIGLPRA